jgi:uncharacterized protein
MSDFGLHTFMDVLRAIWEVTAEMSAFLLLGFLVAGLLSVFIDPQWLEKHLGGRGLGPVLRASLFGVPLPLCSCGVIPVAASLRSHGASKAATTAFLLSTPQTGVDSIMITYTMLGPAFAIFRPVMALLTGILGGSMVQALDAQNVQSTPSFPMAASSDEHTPEKVKGFLPRLKAALDYGSVTLPGDIGKALLIGVIIAGILSALIPDNFLAQYLGRGPLSIALMMVVGIPLYVCATASVPLAVGFIMIGASPGAALAFLIAGPATNAATITTIGRVLGRKTTVIYLLTVAISAFGGGLLLDWLVSWAQTAMPVLTMQIHQHGQLGWFDHLSGVVLVLIMTRAWFLARSRGCGCDEEDGACGLDAEADHTELEISGMNCSHCSGSVERALGELSGVESVQVYLDDGRAVVQGSGVDADAMITAVVGLGFKARLKD